MMGVNNPGARPNPAWNRRPKNLPWDDHDTERLIDAVKIGVAVWALPPAFKGHDLGDILQKRMELIRDGLVALREEL
jgi:hypothetical protein